MMQNIKLFQDGDRLVIVLEHASADIKTLVQTMLSAATVQEVKDLTPIEVPEDRVPDYQTMRELTLAKQAEQQVKKQVKPEVKREEKESYVAPAKKVETVAAENEMPASNETSVENNVTVESEVPVTNEVPITPDANVEKIVEEVAAVVTVPEAGGAEENPVTTEVETEKATEETTEETEVTAETPVEKTVAAESNSIEVQKEMTEEDKEETKELTAEETAAEIVAETAVEIPVPEVRFPERTVYQGLTPEEAILNDTKAAQKLYKNLKKFEKNQVLHDAIRAALKKVLLPKLQGTENVLMRLNRKQMGDFLMKYSYLFSEELGNVLQQLNYGNSISNFTKCEEEQTIRNTCRSCIHIAEQKLETL